jgi:hypothetical protein
MDFKNFKPFLRLCAACGLSLAVVVGEEHEHLHVETQANATGWQASDIVVATTSASAISLRF